MRKSIGHKTKRPMKKLKSKNKVKGENLRNGSLKKLA